MVIVEFSNFTKAITALMPDDEYRRLQAALVENPALGELIQGTGGLRKLRWSLPGRGKRGGVRIIYYWWVHRKQLLMLLAYPKNMQAELTDAQRRLLAKLVEEELQDG
jgi:mRNA-degrading endonuclease RelE of RelBE toxin-antitoxin system